MTPLMMAPNLWEILNDWLSVNKKQKNGGEVDLAGIGDGNDASWEQNNFEGIIEKITEDFESRKARNKARRDALIAVVCHIGQ